MKSNCLQWLWMGVWLALAPAGFGFPGRTEGLPDEDWRPVRAEKDVLAGKTNALEEMRQALPGTKVEFNLRTGTPHYLRMPEGYLAQPARATRLVTIGPVDPHRPTKDFLRTHRALFGHGPEVLDTAPIQRDYTAPHNGLRTTVWQQERAGISVYEGVFVANTLADGKLVTLTDQLVRDVAGAETGGIFSPTLTAPQAVVAAAAALGITVRSGDLTGQSEDNAARPAEQRQRFRTEALAGDVFVRLRWLPLDENTLRLCWEVMLSRRSDGEGFLVLADAATGKIWLRHGLTHDLSDASYRVYFADSPTPLSPGFATPTNLQPAEISRVLITTNAFNTNASPLGWIVDGDNQTVGNNVDAHADRDNNNLPDTPRPQGSPFRVFDPALSLTNDPLDYTSAAVVNLFFWCNWMHDKLYDYGFTEEAGNFQNDNFGRGGFGGDAVQADAQDGAAFNNANFTTFPDGYPSRMQMFIFNGPSPRRDGDLDTEIILHEYAHGLTTRLVGAGNGMGTLQAQGLGEGWSDFYAMALLSEPGDDIHANYAYAAYVSRHYGGLDENYYYGIRRYPYATDLAKNPLTFKDLDPFQADSHFGIPRSPVADPSAVEVHNLGEIWCSLLWQARANFITKYGYATGNPLILQLVTDALKLTPPNPNYVQARDAILLADQVNNGGANQSELWQAFAKRGLGYFATSPASSTTVGLAESFALPDDLGINPATVVTMAGQRGGPFVPNAQTFTLTNVGVSALVWTLTADANWLDLSVTNGTLAGHDGLTVTASLNLTGAALLPEGVYTNTLTFSNLTSGVAQTRSFLLRVGQPNYLTELFDRNDFDLSYQTFTFTPDGTTNFYGLCREPAASFPTDPAGGTPLTFTAMSTPYPDDSYVTITPGGNVSLYGKTTNVIFVNANGSLTFGGGDTDFIESVEKHFSRPRFSAFFHDLDPTLPQARVSWQALSNRVAVTYERVANVDVISTNSFQLEMFYDGRLRLTYLQMDSRNGLVGVSAGNGLPANFTEADFSAGDLCGPALQVTLPTAVTEGDGTVTNAGTITLPQALSSNLTVSLFVSDASQLAVPVSVLVPAGETNAFFDLTPNDDAVLNGSRAVIVTALAPHFLNGFGTVFVHDNETADLTVTLPAEATEGDAPLSGTVSVSAAPAANVRVSLVSDRPEELLVPASVVIPAGQTSVNFSATVVDDGRIDHDVMTTVTASVTNWTDGYGTVTVHDNESTALTLRLPAALREGNGTVPLAGLVGLSGTLPTNLTVTLGSTDAGTISVPATIVIIAGQKTAAFDLTVGDDGLLDGDQSVTITAEADGFTLAQGNITVSDDETPPAPANPFPPHLSATNAVSVDLAWSGTGGEGVELLTNGGFELGSLAGWTTVTPTNSSLFVQDGTYDPVTPDSSTPPTQGAYSALFVQTAAGTQELYQDVTIPAATGVTLAWADRIRNFAVDFNAGQNFRVEVRSLSNVVQSVVWSTAANSDPFGEWAEHTADLTAWAGQTVRVAFVLTCGTPPFDLHLDHVRLQAATPPVTTYEVYLGTNENLGPGDFLGSTSAPAWTLPDLSPVTTYYWQVVAVRSGTNAGPVWQFTTVPGVTLGDASGTEGNDGTTTLNFPLMLSAASSNEIVLGFTTSNGLATAGVDYEAAAGTVTFAPGETNQTVAITVYGDTTYELNEAFSVVLNGTAATLTRATATGLILNDDPFLAAIGNQTVVEGSTLSFAAIATPVTTVTTQMLANFEGYPISSTNGSVLFRNPRFLSATSALISPPDISQVTNVYPGGHSGGSNVLRAAWNFTASSSAWLALTTENAPNLPNLTVDFTQVLSFDVYCDREVKLGLGLRETATTNEIGANGGTTGAIEFVGVSSKTGNRPNANLTLTTSVWQHVSFNLPVEAVTSFSSGNGVLESATGKGVLHHLNFTPVTTGAGACNVYLDNFAVIRSNVLTFALSNAPAGASIQPQTGIFTWTPSETQGPGEYTMTVHVTEMGSPPTTDERTFTVTVLETNDAPVLSSINPLNRSLAEGSLLTVTNFAADGDVPAQTLTYSLGTNAPAGMTINPADGTVTWTPTEAQGPVTNRTVSVIVTDDGTPALSDTRTFFVTVTEVNAAPVFSALANRTVSYGTPISLAVTATDADLPANTLTYSLLAGGPTGAVVNATNGLFQWTPAEAQSPGTNTLRVRVVDNGTPNLSATNTFVITVIDEPIIQSLTVAGGNVTVTWSAVTGKIYRLQWKEDLDDAVWTDVAGDVTAAGPTALKSEALPVEATRYYRVAVLP